MSDDHNLHNNEISNHASDVQYSEAIEEYLSKKITLGAILEAVKNVTLAFDCQVALQNIMTHGLCKSPSVWTYLQNASKAASTILSTFSSVVSSSL